MSLCTLLVTTRESTVLLVRACLPLSLERDRVLLCRKTISIHTIICLFIIIEYITVKVLYLLFVYINNIGNNPFRVLINVDSIQIS